MTLNLLAGFGGDDYEAEAIRARESATRDIAKAAAGGAGSPIAVVLDLLGINHSVAKAPKPKAGKPEDTGDLASSAPKPNSETVAVTNKKGDVVGTVQQAIKDSDPGSMIQPLSMAPLQLSNDGLPRSIPRVDPDTGRPFGT